MDVEQFIPALIKAIDSSNPERLMTAYLRRGDISLAIFYKPLPGIETGSYVFQVDAEMAKTPIGDLVKAGFADFYPPEIEEKEIWFKNYEKGISVTHIHF